jgi:DNA polymerase III epsilon subunit family exonuclease
MTVAILIALVVVVVATIAIFSRKASPTPNGEETVNAILPEQFVIFDLETTGLDAARHEIIEFGAVRMERHLMNQNSTTYKAFSALVKPINKIPAKITQITGITQAMVDDDGQSIDEALSGFLAFIGDLPLVAYNASFDMGFLRAAAAKNGFQVNNECTCALKMARKAWPFLKSFKLAELARMLKLPEDDAHRAIGDCRRTAIIYGAAASTLGVASLGIE